MMNYQEQIPQQPDSTFSEPDKDGQIAELHEEIRRLKLKQGRKLRNKDPREFVHPKDDATFHRTQKVTKFRGARGLAAAILKHGSRQIMQSYYDPGPAQEGWVNTPSTTFERDLERTADRLNLDVPIEFIQEAGLVIEKRVDSRYRTTEDRFRRAINSIALLAWLREGGPEPKWWELHNVPEEEGLQEEGAPPSTDSTDAVDGDSEEAGNQTCDDHEEDGDAPDEYYVSDHPVEDGAVEDVSGDDESSEWMDDEEDDEQ